MNDVSQWTFAELLQRLPMSMWWWLAGMFVAASASGFSLARWVRSRKLENVQSELVRERSEPKTSIVLGAGDRDVGSVAGLLRFTFSEPEFIHPEIVEELEGWLSDGLPVYAAVDLEGAMKSNRFVRSVQTKPTTGSSPWVLIAKED